MNKQGWLDALQWDDTQLNDISSICILYCNQGKYSFAKKLLKMVLAIDPDHIISIQLMGAILLEEQKNEEAEQYLDHAFDLDPHHPETLVNLAKVKILTGQRKKGLLIAEQNSSSSPFLEQQMTALLDSFAPIH